MTTKAFSCTLALFAFLVGQAVLAQPEAPAILPPVEARDAVKDQPKQKVQPKQLDKDKEKKTPERLTDSPRPDFFQDGPTVGSDMPSLYNPQMMGDWPSYYARQMLVVLGSQTTTRQANLVGAIGVPVPGATTVTTTPIAVARPVLVPAPTRGAFKIAENSSPMPLDRVFFTYNYFSGLGYPQTGQNAPLSTTQTTQTPPNLNRIAPITTTTTITTTIPGATRVNLNREVFGFEKTFLDGYASIEVRAPILQQGSAAGYGINDVGDLTIIGKYALLLDRTTGNVFSIGLAITAPTGPSIPTTDGNFRDTLVQPFFGYIWNRDRFFVQAFHSIVVPTDARDVTLAFNDVGIGYKIYRASPDRFLHFVAPVVEAHLTTPLNHRDLNGPFVVPDMFAINTGLHFGFFRHTKLSFAAVTPMTGPRPFRVEGLAQLNLIW